MKRTLKLKWDAFKKRHLLQPNMLQLKLLKKQKLSVQIIKFKSLQKTTCPTKERKQTCREGKQAN